MTREEKLYSMTMKCLVEVAEAEGIKIDKKGSKQKAVEKILAYEAAAAEVREEETLSIPTPMEYTENGPQLISTNEADTEKKPEKKQKTRQPKRTFENLVADIPSIGNIKLVPNSKRTAVHVKRGNQRIFGYSGAVVVVNLSHEDYLKGLEYETRNYGFVVAPTRANMLAILKNAR